MTHDNHNWLDLIPKLRGWITGFITFVTALAGFIRLWQGDASLVTAVLLVVGAGGGWLGCAYLAFERTPPLVPGGKGLWKYPRWRPWALAGLVIISLLTAGTMGYHFYQQFRPPTKVIILVANFDGPEAEKYRVTDAVWEGLSLALEPYNDVQVERVERTFKRSSDAHAEGDKRKAAIVIWGWYGVTTEAVPLSVHFEVLLPPRYMPELGPRAKGMLQTMAVAELESFTLQTRLSAEMAYLSLFTVGMARYAAKDWEGAIARFSDALNQTTERVPALDRSILYFHRGNAYGHRGDYDLAFADCDKAIELDPDYAEAYISRGIVYAHKGAYDLAFADFNQAIELNPDLAEAYVSRGIVYAQKGDYDLAFADFNQAIELNPDLAAEAYIIRGAVYYDQGDYEQAIADCDKAIELNTDLAAEAYTIRGTAYYDQGDYEQAIADCDKAIELDPDYAEAYNTRGIAYHDQGDCDLAFADFDKAIELNPNYADAYNNRGVAYYDQGDYDQAIADCDKAIELDPDYAEAYNTRGIAYGRKGDHDQAMADYDKAIELKPDYVYAYNNRGTAYYDQGDYDLAVADYNKVIELNPDLAEAYYNRGLAYMLQREKEKAIADLKKVLNLSKTPALRRQAEEQLKELGAR